MRIPGGQGLSVKHGKGLHDSKETPSLIHRSPLALTGERGAGFARGRPRGASWRQRGPGHGHEPTCGAQSGPLLGRGELFLFFAVDQCDRLARQRAYLFLGRAIAGLDLPLHIAVLFFSWFYALPAGLLICFSFAGSQMVEGNHHRLQWADWRALVRA